MPTISKKEYEEYKSLCYDRDHGRILTPDGLRLICEGLNRDPEAIGYLIHQMAYRIMIYEDGEAPSTDDDNPIIRVADDAILPSEYIQSVEKITLDMLYA